MTDPHHIWNVIYIAQSNKRQPATSPNTAPATQSESHDWSASHMKRHLQCAEQQASPSNFPKYCACHAKWISWLIHITYETSFTMRRATVNTLQPHQILRLPRKMNLMIDPHHIWNVIYNARSNRQHPPTSPKTAPATQNECHDWATSQMKRHLQCAEQQATPSNLTKYCACHAKWISWLIHITYETSFTMRGATGITLQPHQILRLPRKMNLMIDPHHIWNVIYIARSKRHHPPTSPNIAPATQNECHDWATSQMKRHLQCAEQQATPSNLTKYSWLHIDEVMGLRCAWLNIFWCSFWHRFWHTFWDSFWHSVWHSFWHIFWQSFWQSFWHIFWHSFWHIFWHFFWHIFWYSCWHCFWHSFWDSFWHSFWHIFWQFLSDISFDILSDILSDKALNLEQPSFLKVLNLEQPSFFEGFESWATLFFWRFLNLNLQRVLMCDNLVFFKVVKRKTKHAHQKKQVASFDML